MRINKLHNKSNKTIEEICKNCNIPIATYKSYLYETREPKLSNIIKLAKYFNVSLDYLCEHETKNLLDISKYTETQKAIITELEKLNERNQTILFGYITHMIYE